MPTDRNTGGESTETTALVRELSEALTAVGNYLAAAHRIIAAESRPNQDPIAAAIEKSAGQCERASEAVRRLHALLLSDNRPGDGA